MLKIFCLFFFFLSPEGWSGQGCQTKIINDSQTECVCNHLTHFAVLMDFTENGDSVPVSYNFTQLKYNRISFFKA